MYWVQRTLPVLEVFRRSMCGYCPTRDSLPMPCTACTASTRSIPARSVLLIQLQLSRVSQVEGVPFFFSPWVFFHFSATGACSVSTDLMMRVNVRTTTYSRYSQYFGGQYQRYPSALLSMIRTYQVPGSINLGSQIQDVS